MVKTQKKEMAFFNKNAVITGLLDSYCLLCEIHLKEEDEIRSHIEKLSHKENLTSNGYDEKYKDDGIRKVKQGYYCEYCNSLYPTALLVHMHVTQHEHLKRKKVQLLRRQGSLVILNGAAVDDDAWHGLSHGSCSLCDIDYLDKNEHKTTPNHILQLVQSKVELGPNARIYRKKDDVFFCLICKELFAINNLETHFDQKGHIKLFDECCELFKHLSTPEASVDVNEFAANLHDKNDNEIQAKSGQQCREKIREIKTNDTNMVQTEMALETIPKSKIKELMNGTTAAEANDQSPDSCHEINEIPEINKNARKRINRVKKFAEVNNLALKQGTTSAFCSTCNVTISSSLKRMKEHVTEITHKRNAEDLSEILSDVKPTEKFVERRIFIEEQFYFTLLIDVVLNEKFCLSLLSYSFMTRMNSRIRCQLCEINLNDDKEDIMNHVNSKRHSEAHGKVNVFCALKHEFVREVRPGLYHCGFCNIIEGNWRKLKDHLNSAAHREKKAKCNRRLAEHMPDIQRRENQMAEMLFRHMLFNMFN